jgi:short-subunit dehydrogenase
MKEVISSRRKVNRLRGKNIFITGASGGLGEALVDACVKCGAQSIVMSGRNSLELQRIVDKYQDETSCKIFTVVLDLSGPLPPTLMDTIRKEMGDSDFHINVLINNAGMGFRGTFLDSTMEVQRQVIKGT